MKDDEPAFLQYHGKCMTLRDYFAAKAMQGAIVNASATSEDHLSVLADLLSKGAYIVADAMLKARQS